MGKLLFEQETYAIRGACFEVYREKGSGYLEAVYQECMALEFGLQGIPFESQPPLSLTYKGVDLHQKYVPDFVVFEKVVVELKAVKELTEQHRAQLINYLHSTGMKVGLLVNFAHYPDVQIERFAV